MFSGIVEDRAKVVSIVRAAGSGKLVVRSSLPLSDVRIGDSISIEGVCLTVIERRAEQVSFDLADQTLRSSCLSDLRVGSSVNFERSLKLGDRIHGHLVFGHVDATVKLIDRQQEGASVVLNFSLPPDLRRFIAAKGSVAVAGTSLTVAQVDSHSFRVYLVPHTQELTTLLEKQPGQDVNLEVDMLARYTVNAIDISRSHSKITPAMLRSRGFRSED